MNQQIDKKNYIYGGEKGNEREIISKNHYNLKKYLNLRSQNYYVASFSHNQK